METKKISPEMTSLLQQVGDKNPEIAKAALAELAVALTLPLQQGVLKGNILDMYEEIPLEPGALPEFPLDFLSPGTEKDHTAFTMPNVGSIPQRNVEGDYIMVNTYGVANTIDWPLRYARNARWDVMGRAMQVLEGGFIRKDNQDGFRTILAAAKNRNLVVYDNAATSGLFTKRLITLTKTTMRRNAGGNSTSVNKGKLTDLYMSPESIEDIRSWDLSQIDDITRREIFLNTEDDGIPVFPQIFGVKLHDIDELGQGQEFELYYENTLGGTLPTDKVEIVVGLDLRNRDSFVNPIREKLELFEDPTFHRQRRASLYGWKEHGWAVLGSRRVILASI
jgi:hypothetical protein